MGNLGCKDQTQINSVGVPLFTAPDDILDVLKSNKPLTKSFKRTLNVSLESRKSLLLPELFTESCLHGHTDCCVLLHGKYKIHPSNASIEKILKFCSDTENISDNPANAVKKNDKIKTKKYVQHVQLLQKCIQGIVFENVLVGDGDDDGDADGNAVENKDQSYTTPSDVFEMMLLASWRFQDDIWLEDLLDKAVDNMDTPEIFSLLKEALHDGDEIFVQELISRGAPMEIQVPKRGGASNEKCWETALHHSVTSLQLKSNGSATSLIRKLMSSGRCFLDRRDQENHTPLSLAVQEGHMDVVRLLMNEYEVDTHFDVSPGLTFHDWSTKSNSPGRIKVGMETSNIAIAQCEEVTLVMKALFSMRVDGTDGDSKNNEEENSYVFQGGKSASSNEYGSEIL